MHMYIHIMHIHYYTIGVAHLADIRFRNLTVNTGRHGYISIVHFCSALLKIRGIDGDLSLAIQEKSHIKIT